MSDKCAICESTLRFKWSDTHGVAVCTTCGLPYRLYHYENDERVDKPPSIAVTDEWMPIGRKYWQETRRRTFPAAYDFMNGRRGRTYSGASDDEIDKWNSWCDAHKAELPNFEDTSETKDEVV